MRPVLNAEAVWMTALFLNICCVEQEGLTVIDDRSWPRSMQAMDDSPIGCRPLDRYYAKRANWCKTVCLGRA